MRKPLEKMATSKTEDGEDNTKMDFRHIVYGFGTSNVETSVHEI
jgi:hypothetical protein